MQRDVHAMKTPVSAPQTIAIFRTPTLGISLPYTGKLIPPTTVTIVKYSEKAALSKPKSLVTGSIKYPKLTEPTTIAAISRHADIAAIICLACMKRLSRPASWSSKRRIPLRRII